MPGRLHAVADDPLTLLDGAHNPHGAAALAAELDAATAGGGARVAVVAILADKDVAGVLDALRGRFDRAIATTSTSPRALPVDALARAIAERWGVPVEQAASPVAAVALGRERAGRDGTVVAFGSLSLIAELAPLAAGQDV